MVEASNKSKFADRIRSWARNKAHASSFNPFGSDSQQPTLPLNNVSLHSNRGAIPIRPATSNDDGPHQPTRSEGNDVADNRSAIPPPPAPPPENTEQVGEASSSIDPDEPNVAIRFFQTTKGILLHSSINVLLVFVPVGIAVNFAPVSPTIVFAMNAIAIIPLAGLLSHATESVAVRMGDTVGALMNVTFGNAVELIIFMYVKLTKDQDKKEGEAARKQLQTRFSPILNFLCYLLVKCDISNKLLTSVNEIRIVQASLLGSILANLLLILGMCFLFGGLRFREQIYNSTVTQMSACLLSLSVMSLLLPTAFHASFTNNTTADRAVLQVSRGTSIILLMVYVLYLLFQLKSHAYMYESTPQHVIDEESRPGLLADMLGSSSSSDSSSSSNSSDSDGSSRSNTTAKRIKRALRGRKRCKSSASSKETPSAIRTPSVGTSTNVFDISETVLRDRQVTPTHERNHILGAIASGDEADTDGENDRNYLGTRNTMINFRDFEKEKEGPISKRSDSKPKKKSKKRQRKPFSHDEKDSGVSEKEVKKQPSPENTLPPRVEFGGDLQPTSDQTAQKRPFNIRALSVRPAIPKMLTSTVFSSIPPNAFAGVPSALTSVPRVSYGIRRTNSLPDRLNQTQTAPLATSAQPLPHIMPLPTTSSSLNLEDSSKPEKLMSRTTAIVLLLVSTGLVAICAEFLVASINYLVDNTGVSEAFIGLIILPIVGNAAEHVTAVTVASKNKMDLAIGVAVGSSIQIALFVTPVIVLLGWILNKDMSLYFTLFETVSLFVSAFIVNFLVLDGRSNYLEGALLIAAYVIIAVAAFFYPDSSQQSVLGGSTDGTKMF
ncbi:MAG: hypothetical protein M1827_006185 [Pycnora praestabilis]|nr:MAG: hypothetical protein M1827_006185 [Pycnora praestabilis]